MEACYHCKQYSLVEMDDGITCSNCARSQHVQLFKDANFPSNMLKEPSYIACPVIAELACRLELSQRTTSVMENRLNLLRKKKSSYTTVQIVSALHYIYKAEEGSCTSPLAYTLLYNGCTDCKTLEKCTAYITKTLHIKNILYASNWDSLIEPYAGYFLLNGADISGVIRYCNKIYQRTGMSVYSIAIISIVLYCIDYRNLTPSTVLSKADEKCGHSLKKMYLKVRKHVENRHI